MTEKTERTVTRGGLAKSWDGDDAGHGRLSPEQRAAGGKAARAKTPLEAHAEFGPAKKRDPVGLLLSQAETRVPELVPIRHGRMLVSPFTFYRGAALVMAADLDTTPTSGLRTQLCGDAHLSNFGAYASPERVLVFDINDFDETLPGPFEWDVKRLVTSFVVAGRENGFTNKQSRKATLAAVESYRTAMKDFSAQPILSIWYAHLNIEDAIAEYKASLSGRKLKQRKANFKAAEAALAKAHTRDSLQATGKLATIVDGQRQIISDPPLIVRLDDMVDVDPNTVRARLGTLTQPRRRCAQGSRGRQCRHPGLDSAARGWNQEGCLAAAGQTGWAVRPRRLCRRIGIQQSRRACGRWPAPHAGIQRHISRLAPRPTHWWPLGGLLPAAAPGLEAIRRDRGHEATEHGGVCPALRLDSRPGPCPRRGPYRHRGISRQLDQVRQRGRRLRRDICRPERTRPRRAQ